MAAIEPSLIERRHRWTVAELQRFVECGAFLPEDRIELIKGELIDRAPIGPDHAGSVDILTDRLGKRIKSRFLMRVQNPIVLDEHSVPQPDIAVVYRRSDFYRSQHPRAEDILLIIEVADSTAHFDRTVKIPLYARHGIPEVWLIDLPKRVIEVYREPDQAQYRVLEHHSKGKLVCAGLPEAWLRAEDVLPSAC